jgi:hypothetical protein
MTPEEIVTILDEIGERVGPAGQYAWEAAIRYKFAEALFGIGISAGLFVIGTLMFFGALFLGDETNDAHVIVLVVGGMISILSLFALVIGGGHWVPSLLAPEFAVLKDLIGNR